MLLTLLSNLSMYGPTPIPTQPNHGGVKEIDFYKIEEEERISKHKKILKDDNEIFTFIKIWVQEL